MKKNRIVQLHAGQNRDQRLPSNICARLNWIRLSGACVTETTTCLSDEIKLNFFSHLNTANVMEAVAEKVKATLLR